MDMQVRYNVRMKVKQIAAVVLVLYAAIFLAVAFHDHFKESGRTHCSVCQISRTPVHATAAITFAAFLITVAGPTQPVVLSVAQTPLVSVISDRAPPTV